MHTDKSEEATELFQEPPERNDRSLRVDGRREPKRKLQDGEDLNGPNENFDSETSRIGKTKLKAQREKARREKMNERFSCLAELSSPDDPKSDKASILMDTIRTMRAIKLENDQLKQLNKFLEEKVAFYEKERNLAFYQQNLMFGSDNYLYQPGLFPGGASLISPDGAQYDFSENGLTVMGAPALRNDERQAETEGRTNTMICSQWMNSDASTPQDDYLHPPAA